MAREPQYPYMFCDEHFKFPWYTLLARQLRALYDEFARLQADFLSGQDALYIFVLPCKHAPFSSAYVDLKYFLDFISRSILSCLKLVVFFNTSAKLSSI